ncbi:MAG: HAMP domain-containing protein [Rubrivivax sp.]|nr:MAG: HAMP domain-containing protein [Rubrivivax sp.]
MKLGMKLMAAPVLASAMLLVAIGASVWVMESGRQAADASHDQVMASQSSLGQVEREVAEQHVALYRLITLIASLSEADVQQQRQALGVAIGKTQEGIQKIEQIFVASPEALKLTSGLSAALAQYAKAADMAVDLSTVDPNTGVAAMQSADERFKQARQLLAGLTEQARRQAEGTATQAARSAQWREVALGVVGLLAGLLAAGTAWLMQRRVVQAIRQTVEAAQEVAEGRFDRRLHASTNDEVGDLMSALDRMVQQLASSLHTVRHAAQTIGSASDEIATGNQNLSMRTEQAASSLQQTAASMEELNGTVRQTADAARSANALASQAAQSATRGGEVMSQVVANMADIGASSRKITDIIAVIDGIAFQTNILALNAAVEAARAGEQGRGFAVVAGEVRSLAQRSAQAAREIKTLIGDSSRRVEVGSKLVEEAGSSMQDIVNGVQRVSQIILEITTAADQESLGIGQVSEAVSHLDEVTQQNAALVEQSAAAAEHLRQQAQRLSGVVGQFQLGQPQGSPA